MESQKLPEYSLEKFNKVDTKVKDIVARKPTQEKIEKRVKKIVENKILPLNQGPFSFFPSLGKTAQNIVKKAVEVTAKRDIELLEEEEKEALMKREELLDAARAHAHVEKKERAHKKEVVVLGVMMNSVVDLIRFQVSEINLDVGAAEKQVIECVKTVFDKMAEGQKTMEVADISSFFEIEKVEAGEKKSEYEKKIQTMANAIVGFLELEIHDIGHTVQEAEKILDDCINKTLDLFWSNADAKQGT